MADQSAAMAETADALGALPVWDLSDLYPGMDCAEVSQDLDRSAGQAKDFESRFKGTLAEIASAPDGGAQLGAAIAVFEAIEELIGKLASYAGLIHAGDTADPARAKFYGDIQDRLTTISTQLLFFALEMNRIEDDVMAVALKDPALARYGPWIDDLRQERPYQLADDIERLFHEKSLTGRSAWNRLFDETMTALRFTIDGEELALEPTLNRLLDANGDSRKAAAEALAETLGANLRIFTLITNVLAKDKAISDEWRGFADIAGARHLANRVEPEVVDALVAAVRAAYPRLSHRYYAMKARWLGMDKLNHWDRNAPLPDADTRQIPWEEARRTVLEAYRGFAPEMAEIAGRFFDKNWIDAPTRPGKSPGAFSHPSVPSVHQPVAKRVSIDIKRRMHEMRNIGPERLVTLAKTNRRAKALRLHLQPDFAKAFRRQFAILAFQVNFALKGIKSDLPRHRVEHVLDLAGEQRPAFLCRLGAAKDRFEGQHFAEHAGRLGQSKRRLRH